MKGQADDYSLRSRVYIRCSVLPVVRRSKKSRIHTEAKVRVRVGKRLIDVDKLIDVLLHEREVLSQSCDSDTKKYAKFDAVSDCIGIINHFPEYAEKDDVPVLTVSEVKHKYFSTTTSPVVLKRCDTGREYRKIKDVLDDKNWWEVTGMYPRFKAIGNNYAKIEMVLWCKDRGTAIKELHDEVLCEYVIDKHGCRK